MEKPAENCRNCHHPLPENARFCPACGQKNTDGRLTFPELMQEFISNIFNLDNRIFSTLGALAIPGKLTQSYFEGKHVRYYHPVRLFIVSAGIFTALLTVRVGKAGLENAKMGLEDAKESFWKNQQDKRLDTLRLEVASEFNDRRVGVALDTLASRFKGKGVPVRINTGFMFNNGEITTDTTEDEENDNPLRYADSDSIVINSFMRLGENEIKVAVADLMTLDEEELLEKYQISGWRNKLLFRQYVRITKSGSKFVFYLIGNVIWMMLIMMPMLALVLKLLYIRRNYFYYEHLVFSFHTHSFLFLLFILLMALIKHLPDEAIPLCFVLFSVYLYMAMKRFYGQKHFKTFVKFLLVNLLYNIILFLAFLFIFMASAVFY